MIGVFDSGSGGLTVLSAILKKIPDADVVYFGDIKNAPYGTRSREELSVLTVEAIRLLAAHGATSIVSACNSVSASLAISLFEALAIAPNRLIEMVGPTVAAFRNSDERLLLAATPATVASGIYQNAFHMVGKEVSMLPIEALAGAIEEGRDTETIEAIIRDTFTVAPSNAFDTLILACTHYPLVLDSFQNVLGKNVEIYDPADAVAERVGREWWPQEIGNGHLHFLISKESALFRSRVAKLFPGSEKDIEVV